MREDTRRRRVGSDLDSAALTSLATCDTEEARMRHFALLTRDQQAQAVKRLAAAGMSDAAIARATRMSVDAVCRLLAEHGATRWLFNAEPQQSDGTDASPLTAPRALPCEGCE